MDEAKADAKRPGDQLLGCGVLAGLVLILAMGLTRCGGDVPPADAATMADWRDKALDVMRPCDSAVVVLGERMKATADGRGDAVAGYRAAMAVQDRCARAWGDLDDLEPPAGAPEQQVSDVVDRCRIVAATRREAGELAASAFDGDLTPSVLAGLEDAVRDAGPQQLACAAALAEIAPEGATSAE